MHGDKATLVIVVLPLIVILMGFLYLFVRCILLRPRSHHTRSHRPTMVFLFPANPSHTASQGLDPSVVNSLPIFTFSSDMDPIGCAVCLSEFEEGESGRVLPGCKHTFHVECIDMWLHSHSTCPLCRSLVEPPATTVEVTVPPEPVSATEPRSTSG